MPFQWRHVPSFWSQASKYSKSRIWTVFKQNTMKNTKRSKERLHTLQNVDIRILFFYQFSLTNFENSFFTTNTYKIKLLEFIQKSLIYVVKLYTSSSHPKFDSNIFNFGCTLAAKPGKYDDVTSKSAISGTYTCFTTKWMTLFVSWDITELWC